MDTSETYIKMCEKAKEIQDWGKYKRISPDYSDPEELILDSSNFYAVRDEAELFYWSHFAEAYLFNHAVHGYVAYPHGDRFGCAVRDDLPLVFRVDEVIWLPRQDQLQEIIQPISMDELIRRFYEWYCDWFMRVDAPTACHTTMEQLWLAFVEHELYQKAWNGEDWQAIDLNVTRVR
jgi:hypothetical protein